MYNTLFFLSLYPSTAPDTILLQLININILRFSIWVLHYHLLQFIKLFLIKVFFGKMMSFNLNFPYLFVTKRSHKCCHKTAISLRLNGIKFVVKLNQLLIIQQISVINHQKSYICCCLHRQKFTFNFNIYSKQPPCSLKLRSFYKYLVNMLAVCLHL